MKLEMTLTKEDSRKIAHRAARFGFDIKQYFRFLALQETRQMSKPMIQKVNRAVKAHKEGKTVRISSFAAMFGN